MDTPRRELLVNTAAAIGLTGAAGVAGCLDFAAGEGPQGPDGTPAALSCADDEFGRLAQPFEEPVSETSVDAPSTTFELSAEGTAETYGQPIRLALRNSGGASGATLGEYAYAIQRQTVDGWSDVRGSTTGVAAEDLAAETTLDVGSSYSWSLRLTESAIGSAVPDHELEVCPALGPGTHRFVYWGIVDAPPIGVEFDLVG